MDFGRTFRVYLAWLIAALAALAAVEAFDPGREPQLPSQAYLEWVQRLGEFSRETSGSAYRVHYGFIDHFGQTHRIACEIPVTEYHTAVSSFGYDSDQIERQLNDARGEIIANLLRENGISSYVEFTVNEQGTIHYTIEAPARLIQDVEDRVSELLDGPFDERLDQTRRDLYRRAGFALDGNILRIDYPALTEAASRYLSDCFDALRAASESQGPWGEVSIFLALLQEITYEVPPDRVGNRETHGLWVPADVVVGNHGDCDSKATTFASLWRGWADADLLIISVPRHALVGVAVHHPGPGQSYVQMGNRYFVLCEVAGPGKFSPGRVGQQYGHLERYWRIRG